METKELLLMAEAIANAKSIKQELVFSALEEALALATKKQTGWNISVEFDKHSAEFKTFRLWQVIADGEQFVDDEGSEFDTDLHIYQKDSGGKGIDDFVAQEIPPMRFDRIGAQTVKQAITQKVREAERSAIVDKYQDKVGEVISCVVKRLSKGNIIVELGGIDGIITKNELILNEQVRKGDRIKVLIKEIKDSPRGKQIVLSRSDNAMLGALFSIEVPEIAEGAIEVMATARDAGMRSKMAIKARDRRIDAKGSCIGMRGTRIQAVSNELNGEKIDIVLWDSDPVQFVMNAVAPAEVSSIVVNENSKSMDLAFADEELAKAIGKAGQNIRLASALTGWNLNAISANEADKLRAEEQNKVLEKLSTGLDIDMQTAEVLASVGFDSIDKIADSEVADIAAIDGMDDVMAEELQSRAVDAGLVAALGNADASEIFMDIDGVDEDLANALIANDITTLDDLAELSVDELLDIYALERELASNIIIKAREKEGWFD
jgi:N utilization substance protein A